MMENEGSSFRFLIVGAGRSGTSLLAGLLDQHSAIGVGFEYGAVAYLRGKELVDDRPNLLEQRAGGFRDACLLEAEKSEKRVWGNKITTEQLVGINKHNYYNAPALDVYKLFFEHYMAGIKVIYILRDGRACIQSKIARTGQPLEQAVDHWKLAVQIYDLLQERQQTLFVRFESLVADPRASLRKILEFLGQPYEEQVMEGTMNPKMLPQYRRPGIEVARGTSFDVEHASVPFIREELIQTGYL
jgi:LPS sulfotransferase NodH